MLRILLFGLMFFCVTSFAQQKEPVLPPFFQGDDLPAPSQQNLPWAHRDDALSKAVAKLFEQGLADPRGLEYREIEITVGNPWNGGMYPVKTHGWILQDSKESKFAVAWNGLVYPVIKVGDAIDLHKDLSPDPKMQAQNWDFNVASEELSINFTKPMALKLVLLMRLGEMEMINRMSKQSWPEESSDPYLNLAKEWTWFAFERAVCAHERGDDRLALADARMLAKVQPLIEAEANLRGFKPPSDSSGSGSKDSNLSYLPFLKQLPSFLSDCEHRVADKKNPPQAKKDISGLIDDLQNVNIRQSGQPGWISLSGDSRVVALVKRGDETVEPLLNTMENDSRLTRSVSFTRDFMRSRHLISVSEAAYAALTELLSVQFKSYSEKGEPFSNKEMASQIRAYWSKMGALPPFERYYETLKDDKADKDQWLQAAARIVQPTDVETHGGWTTIPDRKPDQKIELRGENLRDGRTPSVSQLMAQRSDDIAGISTQSSFEYLDAGRMALALASWDKTAAIPVLKKRLMRAWSIGEQPNDGLAGDPAESLGEMIAQMTLARVRCGDESGYDEYAAWIQKVDLKNVWFHARELQKPLCQGTARPSIGRAIDYLFNDPKSPWSDILAKGNDSWFTDFWKSSLPQTAEFRKQASRGLADKTIAGDIIFYPRKDWTIYSEAHIQLKDHVLSFSGSNGDPDTPPSGEKRSFRVCDVFAYLYSEYQEGPKFQLFWPEAKRDAGVMLYQKWLSEKK